MRRPPWVDLSKPDYVAYHDQEWGVPVHDDRTLFEFLTLEAAQAGLSWYTMLRKRAGYREEKRGFRFFGSTIVYAHMQATGMVNDHSVDCFPREELLGS